MALRALHRTSLPATAKNVVKARRPVLHPCPTLRQGGGGVVLPPGTVGSPCVQVMWRAFCCGLGRALAKHRAALFTT